MKKITKIYAARGIMEWLCRIVSGKCAFVFNFSGGAATGFGEVPALYSTSDPVRQAVIENSHYFKSGKIFLRSTFVDDVNVENSVPAQKIISQRKPKQAEVEHAEPKQAETDAEPISIEAELPECALESVVVSDIASAKSYLMERYGTKAYKLRTRAAVIQEAKEKGIIFEGI